MRDIINLGRKLNMLEPEADCSELEHSEERRAEFVIARGHASDIFDLVEDRLTKLRCL